MLENGKSKIKERNIGLEILRVLLCFWVLLFHFLHKSNNKILNTLLIKKFHVPCFFFISFFYFFPIVADKNIYKMKLRLERLFIPFILWPSFIWSFNNIIYLTFNKNRIGRLFTFEELTLQILTGRKFMIQLWFLFHLLFLSIIFFILSYLYQVLFFLSINLIATLFYVFQYFRYNYFYNNYKDCIAHSLGHFISSFPIAVTAFNLYKIKFIRYLEIKKNIFSIIIFLILLLIFVYGRANTYDGIDKNIFASVAFSVFNILPFNKYINSKSKKIIYIITSYTKGVYCLHNIIIYYFNRLFKLKPSLFTGFIIYDICYIKKIKEKEIK